MNNVALGAEAGASKDGGCGESGLDSLKGALVVGSDVDPGRVFWESRQGGIKELAAGEEGLEEREESKLANAFRAERICKPSGSCATAFPEEDVVGGDDPSKGAGALHGAAVRAKEKRGAADEVLGEAVDFTCLESTLEKFRFPVAE